MVNMYRQGDILLKKIEAIPKGVHQNKSDIILKGETTGHAHRVVNGTIFSGFRTGEMYVEAEVGAALVHEDSKTGDCGVLPIIDGC